MGRHVTSLGHIILIPSQQIFALSRLCCVLSGEATNTNSVVFRLIRLRLTITPPMGLQCFWYLHVSLLLNTELIKYFELKHILGRLNGLLDFDLMLNTTFSNISAISWRPVLVVEEAGIPGTTDHGQATGKLYHLRLWVECTLFCNLQSRARTHAVLVIGLYELLGNPTT